MVRLGVSRLLLLLSGADAFIGPSVVGAPRSSTLLCHPSSSAVAPLKSNQLSVCTARGWETQRRRVRCCCGVEEAGGSEHGLAAPVKREEEDRKLSSRRRPENGGATGAASLARKALVTIALAVVLMPAVSIGGMALPSMGRAGTGGGLVAPAFADLEPLPLKSYSEEFSSGLAPVTTVRGLWRTRETRNDGTALPEEAGKLGKRGICAGRLSFKGFVGAGKGTVEYRGCGDRVGKGRWLTKPKNVVNGRITLSARWKIKFSDGTSLLYRGDVVQDAEGTALRVDTSGAAAKGGSAFQRPDAHIRGEVLRPITNIQGTMSEKKVGDFEADLIELPSDKDKM